MLPLEREALIIEELKKKGTVKVEDLAEMLNVTPMTIRRDLDKLEKQGLAYRSHGGAVLQNPLLKEQNYDVKRLVNQDKKQKIAQIACEMIKDGDTILLDAGTTSYELALLLKKKNDLTVITNDLKIALELYTAECRVFIAGGQIQKETGIAIGTATENFISNIRVDISFIGTSSIGRDWVLYTPTLEKASLKRKMVECAKRSVLLADSSKFFRESFAKICSFAELDVLITDKEFSSLEAKELEKTGIKIMSIN
ncbi:MAG: DeoR/GlpR family DNA-binding transcription regulator [Caulobacteraceae bacterium]